MFKIKLELPSVHFSGRQALAVCRKFGLNDNTHIHLSSSRVVSGWHEPSCEVSEQFAAKWFTETQTEATVTIPESLLMNGDLRFNNSNGYAVTFANITDERIIELFESARILGLKSEIERLKNQIENLLQCETATDDSE